MNAVVIRRPQAPVRQRGAIALMFALTLVTLLCAAGLAIDLGRLYVLKSELQNGADSAALAGAKEINLSSAGITKATSKALAFAAQNAFNFGTPLTLTSADISFSSSPTGPWVSVGEALASPSGKSFIRVTSGDKTSATYLMAATGITSTVTSATAVAGRFVVDITPLGICAQSASRLDALTLPSGAMELKEFGFRRGITYDMLQMGPIAGPADPMLLNPVDSPPTACAPNHSSATFTAPFVCQGNSTVASNATAVYANTGVSVGPIEKALNSRFDQYPGGSPCIPATAPPDRNIQEYAFDDATHGPARWMSPAPGESASVKDLVYGAKDGPLWSYSRPLRATGIPGDYSAGTAFDTSDWAELYAHFTPPTPPAVTAEYPSTSPYAQTSGQYFKAPTHAPAPNRRLINMAIVDCSAATSNAMSCKSLPILGVGRFFLQAPVNLSGTGKGLYVEFAGLIEPVPNSEIKLYR